MLPPVTGYLDRPSRRPGGRVVSGDPNPAGPGMDLRPMPDVFDQRFEGLHQPARLGSSGHVQHAPRLGAVARLATDAPLRPGAWHRLWLSHDPATGRILLGQAPLGGQAVTVKGRIARSAGTPTEHFTGKLEDPMLLAACVADWPDPLSSPPGELRGR